MSKADHTVNNAIVESKDECSLRRIKSDRRETNAFVRTAGLGVKAGHEILAVEERESFREDLLRPPLCEFVVVVTLRRVSIPYPRQAHS